MLELKDLQDFSITSWYGKFIDITIKTIIIEVPSELLLELQCGRCGADIQEICLEEDINKFKNALNTLNKKVFIKSNWHAPMDAKAFSFGHTLTATNLDDLMMFLSASDIILKDFLTSTKCVPFSIAFKKWMNIHPASEFRCIIINNILRGITPRDWPTYYAHFKEDGLNIIDSILAFFVEHIKLKFSRQNYTFDILLTYPEKPILVDFGPLNNKTNLYAFKWKEIHSIIKEDSDNEVAPVFRYLDTDIGIITKS